MNFSVKLLKFFISSLFFFAAILLTLYLIKIISTEYLKSILLAFLVTTLNASVGFFSVKIGLNKSAKKFVKWVFGGIIFRMFATLLIVVLILVFLEINRISFIFSILFFYVFYLIAEIVFLNFHSNY